MVHSIPLLGLYDWKCSSLALAFSLPTQDYLGPTAVFSIFTDPQHILRKK